MLKNLEQQAHRWSIFVTKIDVAIALVVAVIGVGGVFVIEDRVAVIGLILSIAIAYITTIRPFLRKPRLKLFIDEIRCSAPTLPDDSASWFIRFGILNYGLTAARSCVGRLVGVWTEQGEQLEKFDPLTLYWARQDSEHTGFNPVEIQWHGDFEYLDIAQFKKNSATPLTLRIALQPPMTLSKGTDSSPSPGVEPALRTGTYYIQVAIYTDDANIPPRWFEIACSERITKCGEPAPCSIKEKRPRFAW